VTVAELIEQLKTLDQKLDVGYYDDDYTWTEIDTAVAGTAARGFNPDGFDLYEQVVILKEY